MAMRSARIRAVYKSILESLDNAESEVAKENNSEATFHIDEARELLSILMEDFEDEYQELDFG